MNIKIFIDNNVWDKFFENQIELSKELPASEFELRITAEAEFEIRAMPEKLSNYVRAQIEQAVVKTDLCFGFYDDRHSPDEQRAGGFGDLFDPSQGGRFIELDEQEVIKQESNLLGEKNSKTRLYKHEADIALAARSVHSVVLTYDKKRALKRARERTERVINLNNWDNHAPLSEYIKNALKDNIACKVKITYIGRKQYCAV
ncbi:MAG: hypothetical protein R8K20_02400 [Gallionellaceae bacterium]